MAEKVKYLKEIVPHLQKKFGEEKAQFIIDKAWQRYAEIVEENKDEPKAYYTHTRQRRTIGWVLLALSVLMIAGALAVAVWDGFRNGFTFLQFFIRLVTIFTVYKLFDMIFFDYFLLLKLHFFQHYYPEVENAFADPNRKYGFNIKSQLVKLISVFPAISALVAWICTLVK